MQSPNMLHVLAHAKSGREIAEIHRRVELEMVPNALISLGC